MLLKVNLTDFLLFANFFLLSMAGLAIYYYSYRLRQELKRSNILRKEAEKYQSLCNTIWDGVFQADATGQFTFINRAGAQIFGYEDPKELMDAGFETNDLFLQKKHRGQLRKKTLDEGFLKNFLAEIRRRDGEAVSIEITANVLRDEGGNHIGYEGIFRDVTQRVRTEKELINYSENLEKMVQKKTGEVVALEKKRLHLESLATIGQTVAMIVHEIRNPVSSVKVGLTGLLRRDSLTGKDRSYVELAALEVSNLERVLNDLRDYSKPLEILLKPQNINDVLDLALAQLSDEFVETGISLMREFAEDLPSVNVDSGRLQQVFINVLMNARDAMKKGGTISVQTKEIAEKRMVCVGVADEGEGIAKNKLKRLFEPFYSTKDRGTGLGLPIVKRIIEAHGGRVEVQSKRGKGTRVIVELPHV